MAETHLIALILEQYLAYLELRQQMDLEVASEFITMAAQLMFIKTRMLLSLEDEEAKSEGDAPAQPVHDLRRLARHGVGLLADNLVENAPVPGGRGGQKRDGGADPLPGGAAQQREL